MTIPLIEHFPREAEALLCCVSSGSLSTRRDRLRWLVEQGLDWELLLAMAAKHRVLPLLHRSLYAACPEAIPVITHRKLAERLAKNSRINRALTEELLRLRQLFDAALIPVLPYKGTVLAVSAHGDADLRQIWDIDLLVGTEHLNETRALLLSQGYTVTKSFDRAQSFTHSVKNIEIDLHWALTPFYFTMEPDFSGFWTRRETVLIEGVPVPTLSGEDMLLILCLQVAKDCWERRQHLEYLSKVADIAALLNARNDLDWIVITSQSRRKGLMRVLHFGLLLAAQLLEADLPADVRAEAEADARAGALVHQVCRRLFGESDRTVAKPQPANIDIRFRLRQLRFYLGIRERPRDWLAHFIEIARSCLPQLFGERTL